MSATIQDPYLLSSHTVSSSAKKSKGKGVAFGERPLVFAAYSTSPKHEDGLVTLAVNGDGLHVYDLSDLHPIASHTLGPSTSFWSPPLTAISLEDGKTLRQTYVTVESANGVDSNDSGKLIWSWREEVDGDISSAQDKKSTKLQQNADHLFSLQNLSRLVIVAEDGRMTLADADLNVKATWAPENSLHVLRGYSFHQESVRFADEDLTAFSDLLVLIVKDGPGLAVRVIGINQEDRFEAFEAQTLPLVKSDSFVDASFSPSGFLSVLELIGTWSTFVLNIRKNRVEIQQTSEVLHLQGLGFVQQSKTAKGGKHNLPSMLSLGSSYVLLAGISASREIALLLWDIQYGILLHSHMLPIPSAFEKDPKSVSVSLIQGSQSQALLILAPNPTKEGSSLIKANVLVVPFSVPNSSTIANALGRAGKSNPWLIPRQSAAVTASNNLSHTEVKQKEELLANIRAAMDQGNIEEADSVFYEWSAPKGRDKPRSKLAPPPATASTLVDEPEETRDAAMDETGDDTKIHNKFLDHTFVTRLLQIILETENPSGKQHSSKILRHLLSRHSVSYGMIQTDLFSVLMRNGDWETIMQCLKDVSDVPESASMEALLAVVKHHRSQASTENDMAVDQPEKPGIPHVRSFFYRVIEYPASQVSLRAAIREHFTDADNLMVILDVLADWMDCYADRNSPLELGELTKNEHDVPIVKPGAAPKMLRMKGGGRLPAMEHILSFLQAVLDSSFIQLLQNAITHDMLQRLSDSITPHVSANRDLEALRGPLRPFALAHKKTLADASGSRKKDEVDWRKRRKQAQEQAAINLGPYQIEELVF